MLLNEKEIVMLVIYVSSFFTIMATLFIFFFSYSRRKLLQKEIAQHALEIEYQKKVVQSVITTQEEERARIARDLHDDISSKLNAIYLNMNLLLLPNFDKPGKSEIVNTIIEITEKTIESSGRIAHALLPATIETIGLDAAIKELCSEYRSLESIEIKYTSNKILDKLGNLQALNIYRIIQELISNSLRHGGSDLITIDFIVDGAFSYCEYTDNGCGFEINDNGGRRGMGLANIDSRVEMLKGKLFYNSVPGNGIQVKFTFDGSSESHY